MFNSRVYYCERCMVYFELKVEPGKSRSDLEGDYRSSLAWLEKLPKAITCPSCEKDCEEDE